MISKHNSKKYDLLSSMPEICLNSFWKKKSLTSYDLLLDDNEIFIFVIWFTYVVCFISI